MSDSASNQILNGMTFTTDDFTFSKPKVNKSGGKSVNIVNGASKTYLTITTPLMLTWGVSEFIDDQTGRKSYDMSLQFPKDDYATPETTEFLSKLVEFENSIKTHVKENSKSLLNKAKVSDDVVDALFHPMLRYPKDQATGEPDMTRSPTLRVKLSYWDQAFDCEIYDMKQNQLFPNETGVGPMELIPKAINLATIVRCGGLWFANGKFGVTWRLVQAMVKPRANLKGRCFIQLSDSDKSRLNKQADDDEDAEEVTMEVAESSDDEDVGGSAAEVAPVVVKEAAPPDPPSAEPVKKKKVVRRVVKKKEATSSE
jgi:hypothetical protein